MRPLADRKEHEQAALLAMIEEKRKQAASCFACADSAACAAAPLQVEGFDRAALMRFWQRWYFPANAVLYIVGDFDRSVEAVKALVDASFGAIPPGREPATPAALPSSSSSSSGNGAGTAHGSDAAAGASTSAMNGNGAGSEAQPAALGPLKRKHKARLHAAVPLALF